MSTVAMVLGVAFCSALSAVLFVYWVTIGMDKRGERKAWEAYQRMMGRK